MLREIESEEFLAMAAEDTELDMTAGDKLAEEEKSGLQAQLEQEDKEGKEEKDHSSPPEQTACGSSFQGASVLVVQSSAQAEESSVSRSVIKLLVARLQALGAAATTTRECAPLPFVDEDFVAKSRNPLKHKARGGTGGDLSAWEVSCACCDELLGADVVVVAAPCYNFSIPASLKAWVDLVTIVKKTYRYGAKGPEGLLRGRTKAFVVATTGGADVGSAFDFGTRYLRHMLTLLGVVQVVVVAVPHGDTRAAEALIEKLA